jgi:hypothetical protein
MLLRYRFRIRNTDKKYRHRYFLCTCTGTVPVLYADGTLLFKIHHWTLTGITVSYVQQQSTY